VEYGQFELDLYARFTPRPSVRTFFDVVNPNISCPEKTINIIRYNLLFIKFTLFLAASGCFALCSN
jgi:hypothetical protein